MHFILPYFIIILIVIQLYLKKSTRSGSERSKKYWEREQKANSTRKQDISTLNYIKWDDALPAIDNNLTLADILNNSPEALKTYNNIQTLKTEPMLNLSEYSNTDLKLKYGVANLDTLTQYEDNYTSFIKSLSELGHILIEHKDISDAAAFLEYAVKIGSDIRLTYTDLYALYSEAGNASKIRQLRQYASLIKSVNKDLIVSAIYYVII